MIALYRPMIGPSCMQLLIQMSIDLLFPLLFLTLVWLHGYIHSDLAESRDVLNSTKQVSINNVSHGPWSTVLYCRQPNKLSQCLNGSYSGLVRWFPLGSAKLENIYLSSLGWISIAPVNSTRPISHSAASLDLPSLWIWICKAGATLPTRSANDHNHLVAKRCVFNGYASV